MLIVKFGVDEWGVLTQKRATVRFAYDNCFHAKQCVSCEDQDTHVRIELDRSCTEMIAKASIISISIWTRASKVASLSSWSWISFVASWNHGKTHLQQTLKQSSLPHHLLPVELSA
jgi:hypothetical protein